MRTIKTLISNLSAALPATSSFKTLLEATDPSFFATPSYKVALNSHVYNANEFQAALSLGDGIDIRDLSSATRSAFNQVNGQQPRLTSAGLKYGFFESTADTVNQLNGGSEMNASLSLGKAHIGPSFKSSFLNRSEQSEISTHLCYFFSVEYDWITIKSNEDPLSNTARNFFDQNGLESFYKTYGTHYVRSVQPYHLLAGVYSFHFESHEDQQSFTKTSGLSVGLFNVFTGSMSDTVTRASTRLGSSLSITYTELETAVIGGVQCIKNQDVPPPGSTPAAPTVGLFNENDLIKRLGEFQNNVKDGSAPPVVTAAKLSSFRDFFDVPGADSFHEDIVYLGLVPLRELYALQNDFVVMLKTQSIWQRLPTGSDVDRFDGSIAAQGDAIYHIS